MCVIIRITRKAFRTVISRAEFYPISKGCRVSRPPSDVKYHPMNGNRKDLQGQPEAEQTVRNAVQKPLDRLSVKRCRGVVKHDTPAFFQCVSTRRFLSSISPVQLSPCAFTRFVCTMQETGNLPWHAITLQQLQDEGTELPDIASQLTALAKKRKCDQPLP